MHDADAARTPPPGRVERRNLTKGQQAMALAMVYPKAEKLRRKGVGPLETKELEFSQARLSQARTVLRYAPDLAPLVLVGTKGADGLDEAYKEACKRREAANSEEARMATLRGVAIT